MAIWQYQCVSCGGVHEVSVRPAGEAMLLRCIVTRQWNWHEPAAFLAPAAPSSTALAAPSKTAGRRRAAAGARPKSGLRAAARRRARASRVSGSRKRGKTRKARPKARRR